MPISFLRPLRTPCCFLTLLTALTTVATAPPVYAGNLTYAGINLSGGEFSPSQKPGVLYKDYIYPSPSDYAYFAQKGMNTVRLPVLWERIQPTLNDELDATQLSLILKAVEQAKANKLFVVLDIHNYGQHNDALIGSDKVPISAFADLWKRLSLHFANDKSVICGLMNEPHEITSTDWVQAAQAAINAIRSTGANNLVLVPGTAYSTAQSWNGTYYGTPNAEALLKIHDPAGNLAFEVHQYLDEDSSGTKDECTSTTAGAEKLSAFTDWLRKYHKMGFLGEFAAGNNDTCNQALEGMLSYIEQNKDVWLGWTSWVSNPWFGPDYPFNLHPNDDGTDKPQMTILEPHARKITKIKNTSTNIKNNQSNVIQPIRK
ncbi:glycoside hydrolase family 5 protein [Xylella taiwanensis]|uniref:Endoglucanase n=1 Tax=Xylella taiwanensis TaxID=1444770 RepID=Z9JI73_9GAMM|nr:glycoside hydrolase family 5 protein [Xylella taiwanensis]EWS78070.1 cellulase [Xylella taiwanensis]MCD8457496.1 glycoside hydrolase family 5 protein [Xylella taiwanensis]MCD8457655.1 glycoside hydrolase family 5 protein [Xylella taiwanensis]MCD8461220.1 glycoside hydrolase family 5 protein [Xylella taiwanensis]MCD8462744.1 glycoside hydrolase family 5 protein [Xylella taiwanensis]